MARRTRREFLRDAIAGGAALLAGSRLTWASPRPAVGPRIVAVKNEKMFSSVSGPDRAEIHRTVAHAVRAFSGESSEREAWRTFFSPSDVVGLKVNCLGGLQLRTHPELCYAVADLLFLAGVPRQRVVIWDRDTAELSRCGFRVSRDPGEVKCFGTDGTRAGYDKECTIEGAVASCLSGILRGCTAQINMPLVKDHGIVGMTCALKNWLGAVHNPNKFHASKGDPDIADLNKIAAIRDSQRLIITDALKVQYDGGPSYKSNGLKAYNRIIVGTDPVAVDTIARMIIDDMRAEAGLRSLAADGRESKYVKTAAGPAHNLGCADPAKIELIEESI